MEETTGSSAVVPGSQMKYRYVLVSIKADWSELVTSMGLPSWGSQWAPCPVCACSKSTMYKFDSVSMIDDPWGPRDISYDMECKRCEVEVSVDTDLIRDAILIDGGLYADPTKQELGRVLARDIPALRLCAGDRLEPSPSLKDTSMFEVCSLPVKIIFWRQRRDAQGRLATWTLRRNPLFSESIGSEPRLILHLDSLHTLYLCIFHTYCHAVIHTVIRENVFKCGGQGKARESNNLEQLFFQFKRWCKIKSVPLSYQINHLSMSMISSLERPTLKTKAAETGVLMRFCHAFCKDNEGRFELAGILAAAGQCLVDYVDIMKASPFKVPMRECRKLLFHCLRFLTLMQQAGIKDMPKGHLFVHVTKNIPRMGNPKGYSCFWDEGLNLVLSNMASAAHRANWHSSIFLRVRLLPHVLRNAPFALV